LQELAMQVARQCLSLAAAAVVAACAPTHVVSTPAPAPVPGDRIRYAERSDTTRFLVASLVGVDAERLVFRRYVADSGGTITGSVPTDSVAGLQVRVGRRGNAGRGALFGGLVGVAIGGWCASEPGEWVTGEQCLVGYTVAGAGVGLLIGALLRSDVWAPAPLPPRGPERPRDTEPLASAAPVGIGVRIPIRLAGP
jgi:hypothetical protein